MNKSFPICLILCALIGACSKPPETPGGGATTSGGGPVVSAFAQREALRKQLEGTTWLWGDDKVLVKLDKEGVVRNDLWESQGLVTKWEPIDRRTVFLVVEKGRDNDRYAVLTFTEDLQEYDGYDFLHGKRLPRNHKK
jgi:hypothetical protein